MKGEQLLVLVAALAAFSALFSAGFSYYSLSAFRETWVTGFASQANATLNLTVATLLSINFTNSSIQWGSGYVTEGQLEANLTTNQAGGTINAVGGSWSIGSATGSSGFVLENIGNVNATILLYTSKNSTQLLGGTNARFEYNISNIESGSCLNTTGGTDNSSVNPSVSGLIPLGLFWDVNTTNPGTPVCGIFRFSDGSDSLRIGVRLRVPYDSLQGNLSSYFHMIYCQAPGPCS